MTLSLCSERQYEMLRLTGIRSFALDREALFHEWAFRDGKLVVRDDRLQRLHP